MSLVEVEELLDRRGFSATAVADLRDAAGVSLRTLYRRHGSRDELIAAALRQRADRYCALLAEATDVHDLLRRAIDWLEATAGHGCLLLRAAAEHPGVDPVEREVERYHRQLHTVLSRLAEEHADELFLVHEGLVAAAAAIGIDAAADAARATFTAVFQTPSPDAR